MGELPKVALSIRQPWAWLIVHGFKDIENRDWRTRFRGPVLIHAGKALEKDAAEDVDEGRSPCDGSPLPTVHPPKLYPLGGIVGVAEIVDCVSASASPWFVGDFGFVIRDARPLPFRPARGQLGFFSLNYDTLSNDLPPLKTMADPEIAAAPIAPLPLFDGGLS